jgi:DNA-binding PadR family transcriptional regulator
VFSHLIGYSGLRVGRGASVCRPPFGFQLARAVRLHPQLVERAEDINCRGFGSRVLHSRIDVIIVDRYLAYLFEEGRAVTSNSSPAKVTPAMFHILLALSEGARHGLGILKEVEQSAEGGVKLGPGKLYWSINRLVELGLICESRDRPPPEADDPRRRYYGMTDAGRGALASEAERLAKVVRRVRAKGILDPGAVSDS